MSKEIYDVYYSTGGGSLIGGGADVWVNHWIENIVPKLKVKPKLLIHRTKPKGKTSLEKQQEDKIQFEKSVSAGRGGNPGRIVHKKIEKNFMDIFNQELEHHWQGEDKQKFQELLAGARRIHILHGYYSPHKYIVDNLNKIHSNFIHVSVQDVMKATMVLGLDKSYHTYCEESWEDKLCEVAKHPIWIGVGEKKLKHPIEHIPNFYEFKNNLDVSDSNTIGFTSRMETRKCPHFMEGLDSILFTGRTAVKWWKENLSLDTSAWKIYYYNPTFLDKFMKRDWGISHSAHIYEPFGYSIFQALDYGKIPIIAHDWIPSYDYPFRASTPKEFHEQYDKICKMGLDERRDYVFPFREYLDEQFGDKQRWIDNMLRIFND